MYYSHSCSVCSRVFYTYNNNKEQAARTIYYGIKQHLIDYNEDNRESEFDEGADIDIDEVYNGLTESEFPLSGGYELK